MDFKLTKNQQEIFDLVESSNSNILIQGKPGVGKSVLIHALTNHGNKTYTLAAPTGLAALNIGGKTLHSLFMLPVSQGIIHPDFNKFTTNDNVLNNILYKIKHLIIDEVSMVRADMLDYIDRLLRYAKNSDKSFGGVQMILVGDFYQLPPVVIREEQPQLRAYGYKSSFVFDSLSFQDFNIQELTEVLRQKGDPKFIDLLGSAREGVMTTRQISDLNKNVGHPGDVRIRVCGINSQADLVNKLEMDKIDATAFIYQSSKYGEWPAFPAEEVLNLKVGAQVMVKKNGSDRPEGDRTAGFVSKVVNGTLGKITSLHIDRVGIQIEGEEDEVFIYQRNWERKVKVFKDNEWTEVIVASFQQIPLALAWAISIHKSQGQSFDKTHVDASRIFAAGQLYVALSRCRTMAGLSFEARVNPKSFFTNKDVVRFFNSIEV